MKRMTSVMVLLTLACGLGMSSDGCNVKGLPGSSRPVLTITAEVQPDNSGAVTLRTNLSVVPLAQSVNWSFGDGSGAVGLSVAAGSGQTHGYPLSDTYDVAVYAFDASGRRLASGMLAVTVVAPGLGGFIDARTHVRLSTNKGDIVLEMDRKTAPHTCANFEQYVGDGHYDGTVFHRIVPGFVIQGGAFQSLGEGADPRLNQLPHRGAIGSEAGNGLKNARGTISMALSGTDANSGMDQFFINLADNPTLDTGKPPFTVFGKVIEGMDVVDQIAGVTTGKFNVTTLSGPASFSDVPVQDVVVQKATRE